MAKRGRKLGSGETRIVKGFSLKPSTVEMIRIGAHAADMKHSTYLETLINSSTVTLAIAAKDLAELATELEESVENLNNQMTKTNDLIARVRELSRRLGGK
jgi:adenylosuccinate lyase